MCPTIEILSFEGCPHREPVRALVERVTRERGIDADLRLVDVPDLDAAQALRFLGSPTIRVDGHDIEPGADERTDFAFGCRIFRTEHGASGEPDERWLVGALER